MLTGASAASVSSSAARKKWLIVAFSMWTQAITSGCTFYSYGLISAAMNDDFGETQAWASGGITVMMVMFSLMGPVFGRLTDKLPTKLVLQCGILCVSSGFVMLSQSQNMLHVTLVFGSCFAIGFFFLGPVASGVLIGRWFPDRSGFAFGISAIGLSLGGMVYPPLIQALIDGFGWRSAFILLGVALLFITMAIITLTGSFTPASDDAIQTSINAPARSNADHQSTEVKLLTSATFWIISLLFGVLTLAQVAMQVSLVPFAGSVGIPARTSAIMMTVMAFGSVLGKIAIGFLTDRTSLRSNMQLLMAITILVAALLLNWHEVGGLFLSSLLIGFAIGGLVPLLSLSIADCFGRSRFGLVYGYIALVTLPFQFGPFMSGFLFDLTGSYNTAFIAFIILLVAAFPFSFQLKC